MGANGLHGSVEHLGHESCAHGIPFGIGYREGPVFKAAG